ncbi:MAG: winged helix-turn-helix domain-containing protein [Sulfolobales archaeon]
MRSKGDEEDLSGLALKIYIYLLENQEAGPREIARELGIAPSLAYYHLKRFEEFGIVERDPSKGLYRIRRRIRIRGYLYIGNKLVPRLLIYGAFFAGLLVPEAASIILGILEATPELILAMITSVCASSIFIAEGLIAMRNLLRRG